MRQAREGALFRPRGAHALHTLRLRSITFTSAAELSTLRHTPVAQMLIVSLPVTDSITNAHKTLHGGAIATAIDIFTSAQARHTHASMQKPAQAFVLARDL